MQEDKECNCCSVSRESHFSTLQPVNITPSEDDKFISKMAYINGGEFVMGTNSKEGFIQDGEGPTRNVNVNSFYIDRYAVTNEEFYTFIKETGYKTEAEQYGFSFVFHLFLLNNYPGRIQQVQGTSWWFAVADSNWYQPEGIGSTITNRMDHPVIHVSWNDAKEFSNWAGKRLPTEMEWEYAARGGLNQKKYPWGDDLTPNDEHHCNIWQGSFPEKNTKEDGYVGTAPAVSYPPNGYGLYNTSGNVWEWCEENFETNEINKNGSNNGDVSKVMRGGSYLCHHSYCNRYRVAARSSNTSNSSTGNLGFRCARDIK